jgi:TolA-binding protein
MLKADGQSDAAQRTYRELVRNPKYADTPEVKVARAQLKE